MVDTAYRNVRSSLTPDEPAAVSGGFMPCGCRSEGASRWFVLSTAYQAERAVERAVRNLGLPTWLGLHEDTAHHRTLLFPGYLLFQSDLSSNDRWRNLYTLPGVDMVLGTRGERPTPLRLGSLDALFGACAADGVIYQDNAPTKRSPIVVGAVVEIAAGQFTGWRAICTWSSRKRVGVLLGMFGTEIRMSVPANDVRAVPNG